MIPVKNKKIKTKGEQKMFQSPKGMHDVLPVLRPYWDKIESAAKEMASFYNFARIDTPIMESAELFVKTTGEETDVVQKEMYTLKTKGGDLLALRPEFTPGIARAYLEHKMGRAAQPQKLYHIGPVFRHDRPQLGRYRQFTQIGFEVLGGVNDPVFDAQVISLFVNFLEELKIKNIILKINSIGCKVCRPIYKKQLQAYYKHYEKELCADCERRLKINPLKLLDCKNDRCAELKKKAPNFLDKLCVTCGHHFQEVLEYLDEVGIAYVLDSLLVRGLDYYSRTVFEIFVDGPGGEIGALSAGGRYDYLIEFLGGRLTPAVGGACGAERLIAVMKAQEANLSVKAQPRVFVAHAGDLAKKKAFKIINDLIGRGIAVSESLARESLKAQLKIAGREGIKLALILGQKEIYEGDIIVRDMITGLQENVTLDKIVEEIKKRWRG